MSAPVETKVTASTITAAGVVLLMWALGHVPGVDDMPVEVRGALLVLVTGAATFVAGWVAPHTRTAGEHRADPDAMALQLRRALNAAGIDATAGQADVELARRVLETEQGRRLVEGDPTPPH